MQPPILICTDMCIFMYSCVLCMSIYIGREAAQDSSPRAFAGVSAECDHAVVAGDAGNSDSRELGA